MKELEKIESKNGTPIKLDGLLPTEYEHPFDRKALRVLQKTPGLDHVLRKFNEFMVERIMTIQCTGSSIKVTKENYSYLYSMLEHVCDTLCLSKRPDFYLEYKDDINGFVIGIERPIICLTHESITHLTEDELIFLIGHEVGHIKSRHMLYHHMAQAFPIIIGMIGDITLGIGNLVLQGLQVPLSHWYRMSEFTADRAGFLACQNIDAVGRFFMKISGLPRCYYNDIRIQTFLAQAKQFEELDEKVWDRLIKFASIYDSTHPWTVMRTAELLKWKESGEYKLILDGRKACRKCTSILQGTEKFCVKCGNQIQ